MYMDNVLQILKLPEPEQTELNDARTKLQHLLHSSSLYRVQLLLGKATESNLHKECAILYGKLEEHEKALKILVHQLQDHDAAEDYCIRMSNGRDKKYRHRLFYALLSVYLDSSLEEQKREEMLPAAIQLLNSELAEFDVSKVYQRIQQQAGFIEFSLLHFEEARELFHDGQLDVRELISLFPDLFPASSSFIRMNPPLHDIGNVSEMCSFDSDKVLSCRKFLLHYLESIRNSSDAVGCKIVLQLIPSHWSVAILDQFLVRALRSSLHHRYCCRLQSALARGENLQVKFSKIHIENTSVIMTEDRYT
ncbi:UNVERIFIED_CONTAM: Transforming growth factor-beta receptor-associated protein 1 [Trichonephila clavipes]